LNFGDKDSQDDSIDRLSDSSDEDKNCILNNIDGILNNLWENPNVENKLKE